jgi:hypothetical protein
MTPSNRVISHFFGNKAQYRFDDYLLETFKCGQKADEIYIQLEIIRDIIATRIA